MRPGLGSKDRGDQEVATKTKWQRSELGVSPDAGPPPRDQQQALLLDILRRRAGEPVTYAELQAAGIEFPGSVVSELELAGVEIDRCRAVGTGQRPVTAIRLPSAAKQPASEQTALPRNVAPRRVGLSESGSPRERARKRVDGSAGGSPRETARQRAGRPESGSPRQPTPPRVGLSESGSPRQPTPPRVGRSPGRTVREAIPQHRESGSGWGEVRVYRRSPARTLAAAWARLWNRDDALLGARSTRRRVRPTARVLAPLALVLAIAITAIVIASATSSGNTAGKVAAHRHARSTAGTSAPVARTRTGAAPSRSNGPTAQHQAATASAQTPRLPATPVSPPRATALEARGHRVLSAGQYSAAVPILERAVAATGEHISACLEPATENCLTYAYALFDLGRALLLSGHAAAAAGVLQQRLQIDNQRSEVAAQLALARQG